jgi:hypothetical protein
MVQPLSRSAARGATLVLVALALVAALLSLHAVPALAQTTMPKADATLRVIHASPGAPPMDVLVDGQPIMQHIAYGTASDYLTFTADQHRLQIVPTGQTANAAVVDQTVDAGPGAAYILAVYGLLNDIKGAVYDVDLSEIEPGHARVRTINFSPDAGAIDLVETGGDEWFDNVALGAASDYRDTQPGTYSVDLRGDQDRVLKTVSDLTFDETRVYDIVVFGQVADNSLTVQNLVTTVSPPCSEVLKIEGQGSDSCIRLVHAAPDAPPVDVYLNEAQVTKNLAYGAATEYVAVPSGGGRAVQIVPTGAPKEQAVISTNLDFDPGQAYEMLVTGSGNDLQLTITGTDLRPLAAGQARIRLVHASPDAGAIDLGVKGNDQNLFSGVNFRDATHYLVLDAGDYQLEIRPGGDNMTVALQSNATFQEGITYDLILLGRPSDRSLALLNLAATVGIQTGAVATPVVVSSETPLAATVVPSPIGTVTGTPVAKG